MYHFYNEKSHFEFNKSIYIVLIPTSHEGNVGTKKAQRKVTSVVRRMGNKLTLSDLGIIQKVLNYTGRQCHS